MSGGRRFAFTKRKAVLLGLACNLSLRVSSARAGWWTRRGAASRVLQGGGFTCSSARDERSLIIHRFGRPCRAMGGVHLAYTTDPLAGASSSRREFRKVSLSAYASTPTRACGSRKRDRALHRVEIRSIRSPLSHSLFRHHAGGSIVQTTSSSIRPSDRYHRKLKRYRDNAIEILSRWHVDSFHLMLFLGILPIIMGRIPICPRRHIIVTRRARNVHSKLRRTKASSAFGVTFATFVANPNEKIFSLPPPSPLFRGRSREITRLLTSRIFVGLSSAPCRQIAIHIIIIIITFTLTVYYRKESLNTLLFFFFLVIR